MSSLVGSAVCLAKNTLPQVPVFGDRDVPVRLRTVWSREIPGRALAGTLLAWPPVREQSAHWTTLGSRAVL